MRARFVAVGLAALLGMSIAGSASAQEGRDKKKDDSYGYIFKDDILSADTQGASTAQIRVIKVGRRDQLLRPRVHFVPEMLKSVENM
ncbi:hypothetical protein [Chondromyces crocatus]|uniref:Uncharacterized protein n=1 Tax=Chondromyces crocatus TaxID=52 RepID=A0A0K1E8Z4_CHOCO|nr:hypothetical protein [Chondromyces crocatus]AKT37351.1 uncharacterized protein CMC5_014860 [Chondromyces crocatus]